MTAQVLFFEVIFEKTPHLNAVKKLTKKTVSPLPQCLWLQKRQDDDLPCVTSTHKVT